MSGEVDTEQRYSLVPSDTVTDRLVALEHQQGELKSQIHSLQLGLYLAGTIVLVLIVVQVTLWLRQRSLTYELAEAIDEHVCAHTESLRQSLTLLDREAAEVATRIGESLGRLTRDMDRLQLSLLRLHPPETRQ